ncbi:MAG: hypothetical protein MUE42_15520, partial [Opitutaceae bacterium]|nr:hypothetical protein [Opitutaceae bacterium]
MNSSPRPATGLALLCLLGLSACSKPESAAPAAEPAVSAPASASAAAPVASTPAPVAAPALQEAVASTAAATLAAARESLANLKLPDLQTATTAALATLATQTLTQWTQAIEAPPSALTTEVEAVKTALAAEQPITALASLGKLGDYAKSIPGGDALLQSSKQLVSAWALKQGFDTAKISGVLGALQSGDYASLAAQAATLFAKGGVTSEQK